MWILIRWLPHKAADLDLQSFHKKIWFSKTSLCAKSKNIISRRGGAVAQWQCST